MLTSIELKSSIGNVKLLYLFRIIVSNEDEISLICFIALTFKAIAETKTCPKFFRATHVEVT